MVRIAVTGPECTGKTSLARWLAAKLFDAKYVSEFAREYLSTKEKGYQYSQADVLRIAAETAKIFSKAFRADKDVLVVDTDFYVLDIWWNEKFSEHHPDIVEYKRVYDFDLYILCEPDLEWQPDPLRENPNDRDRLFELYKGALIKDHRTFEIAEGQGDERTMFLLEKILRRFPNLMLEE
ncbi:MAG: AAA family ATPase [Flavobacteriales bacterium]